MMNNGGFEAADKGFKVEEEKWFTSPARGLTRRPSSPPAEEVSNLDDSVFDRWASVVPRSA